MIYTVETENINGYFKEGILREEKEINRES